jgi:transcriptional regulator with XRE-family HTH domain
MVNKQRNQGLTNARKALSLTQKEIAKEMGISPELYNSYENLKQIPSQKTQKKISEYFIKKGIVVLEEDLFPEQSKLCLDFVSPEEIENGTLGYSENLALEKEREESLKINLERILKSKDLISQRDLCIVKQYYGIGCKKMNGNQISEYSKENGSEITGARVGQILNSSIHALRNQINSDSNKNYFKEI